MFEDSRKVFVVFENGLPRRIVRPKGFVRFRRSRSRRSGPRSIAGSVRKRERGRTEKERNRDESRQDHVHLRQAVQEALS